MSYLVMNYDGKTRKNIFYLSLVYTDHLIIIPSATINILTLSVNCFVVDKSLNANGLKVGKHRPITS